MFFSWQGSPVHGLRSSSPLLGPKEMRTTDLSTSFPLPPLSLWDLILGSGWKQILAPTQEAGLRETEGRKVDSRTALAPPIHMDRGSGS